MKLLSREETQSIDDVFKLFDKNGDGKISRDELKQGYRQYYGTDLTDTQINEIFDRLDVNRDGDISYNEFVSASIDQQNMLCDSKLEAAFRQFDQNNQGKITTNELKNIFTSRTGNKQIDAGTL